MRGNHHNHVGDDDGEGQVVTLAKIIPTDGRTIEDVCRGLEQRFAADRAERAERVEREAAIAKILEAERQRKAARQPSTTPAKPVSRPVAKPRPKVPATTTATSPATPPATPAPSLLQRAGAILRQQREAAARELVSSMTPEQRRAIIAAGQRLGR